MRWLRSGRSANINLQPDEGAGDSPASSNWAVLGGAEEEVQSVSDASDASSQSAKCFLPNTALPSADGHLLRVEHLKPGDRVRQSDGAEASVVDVKKHPSKKKPYEVVELSTHQGKFACSKSHRVAVPGATGLCDQRADSLKLGDWVIVGSEERKLTKVVNRKEHTDLYEVVFEADRPLEMFPLKLAFGMLSFGSDAGFGAAAAGVAASSDAPPAREGVDEFDLLAAGVTAWAQSLGRMGMNLVLVARKPGPLKELKELLQKHKAEIEVELVTQDMANFTEVTFLEMLGDKDVRVVVHNAASPGPMAAFLDAEMSDSMTSIDVNVRSVAIATHTFGRWLRERGAQGGIVLMSSLAGEVGSAVVANYAATKAYITTLVRGLSEEMTPRGIDVLACVAGATVTPNYVGYIPDASKRNSWIEQEPLEVVAECLATLGRDPVVVTGPFNKLATGSEAQDLEGEADAAVGGILTSLTVRSTPASDFSGTANSEVLEVLRSIHGESLAGDTVEDLMRACETSHAAELPCSPGSGAAAHSMTGIEDVGPSIEDLGTAEDSLMEIHQEVEEMVPQA
ncbi:unnamed protein product [Effrenium voratum]|nr:unnamed protein product [Effrenium voratum]